MYTAEKDEVPGLFLQVLQLEENVCEPRQADGMKDKAIDQKSYRLTQEAQAKAPCLYTRDSLLSG